MGIVYRYVDILKSRVRAMPKLMKPKLKPRKCVVNLTDFEIERASNYFFKIGSKEVKQFAKHSDWKHCSKEIGGILYFDSKIMDGQSINDVENVFQDLSPLHFCKPILDRYSPISYAIMTHVHTKVANHRDITTCLRESFSEAYILHGRSLSEEVREGCMKCKRFKAKRVNVEMSKLHESRITVAPAFYLAQVDLLGPYDAFCEHNHRSSVKVWGLVFKDPASGAISTHVMQKYSSDAFLQAYMRFACTRGHPAKLFIDSGSQLVKTCNDIEYSWMSIVDHLSRHHGTGIQHEICPVGGHNFHGTVERSIKEVKKLFDLTFSGLKLDILSYETNFQWISNELNNLPICTSGRYKNLEKIQLITPNRLLLGRNNRRAASGPVRMEPPTRLLKQNELVYESWWKVWRDEKIVEYIPQPPKWSKSDDVVKTGDIVLFPRDGDSPFDVGWRIGRIQSLKQGHDGKPRRTVIEYKNSTENVFRTTERSMREIAVLHSEGEIGLVSALNEAARIANLLYLSRTPLNETWPDCKICMSIQLHSFSSTCGLCTNKEPAVDVEPLAL